MNNSYFFSALCCAALTCVPACKKEKPAIIHQEEKINTTIELDNTVFETEAADDQQSIGKF